MPAPPNLTPAQMAIAAERRAAREAKRAAQAAGLIEPNEDQLRQEARAAFLKRDWIKAGKAAGEQQQQEQQEGGSAGRKRKGVKVISWNMLAQTLIRRELFPGSDALRWGDRKAMLEAELGHYGRISDILCLQECDRLRDLIHYMPFDNCVQGRGRGKQHGLVILYRSERFGFRGTRVVHLDEEDLSPSELHAVGGPSAENAEGGLTSGPGQHEAKGGANGSTNEDEAACRKRRGGTRQTKNVGLIVGLEDKERGDGSGIIVATAHLFWHPIYQYERVRQFILLIRAIRAFQKEHGLENWPAILAGDFNTSPCEAPYQLLTDPSKPMSAHARTRLEDSRIVHTSMARVGVTRLADSERPWYSSTDQSNGYLSAATSTGGTGANTPNASEKDDEGDGEGEGEGEGELPDSNEKSTAKTRAPEPSDGILSVEELQSMMQGLIGPSGLRSAYDVSGWNTEADQTFQSRGGWPEGSEALEKGKNEPAYTCFTKLFQLTLDYLFIIPPPQADRPVDPAARADREVHVTQVLRPPRGDELGGGMPKKGLGASDHVAVGCEVVW